MNHTGIANMTKHQPLLRSMPGSRAALFGLSLLLHGALLWLFLLAQPGQDRERVWPQVATDLVWIRTPPPKAAPPAPAPAAPLAPAAVARPREIAAARPASPARRPRAERLPKTEQAAPAAPEAIPAPVTEPVVASATDAPAFDREAALASARRIATESEPFRAGMALAQAPARPVYRETKEEKLGHAIAGAKRGNCLGPNAGGNLLTPLMWLIQKKDSGCKF